VKLTTSTLILLMGILICPINSSAQDQNDCFMLDANGQAINLGDLCGNPETPSDEPDSNNLNSDIFQIPIKRREANIAVVEVIFNGKQSFDMLVDTGASGTVLTIEMAQTLGLQPMGTTPIYTAGGVIEAYIVQLQSMTAGGITVKNITVVVAPELPIGLLGHDFFGNYDITIRENTLELQVRK